ncbi:MAG: hypothetical protein LBO20_01255 [Bifidobacteriaceae bacterium]|jgi:hypothetical protein|nr:hypothetical protein [Bifidobacteriaceae bacterium]
MPASTSAAAALANAEASLTRAAQSLGDAAASTALADAGGWVSPAATQYEIWTADTLNWCRRAVSQAELAADAVRSCLNRLPTLERTP